MVGSPVARAGVIVSPKRPAVMTALLHRSVPQVAALMEFAMTDTPPATSLARAPSSKRLEPLRRIDAGVLNIAYYEAGPSDGPAVMLLHGFPYDIPSYV